MTHKRPSPDIDAIRGVLQNRADENNRNPISIYEEDLSINSPVSLEKSIGRMNNSFSRTQVASSLAGSHKLSMEDTKRQLFEDQEAAPVEDVYSNEEHPSVMQNRQENLVRQLLQQQKELQNLENRQKELTELKKVAEARLSAANETANFTLFTQAETDRYDQQMELEEEHYNPGQALQQGFNTSYNTNELEQQYLQAQQLEQQYSKVKPGDRPYDMSEIPYEIEQVNGVAYEDSGEESDEGEEEEGMEDSLEVLQKRLSLLHEKQKWLEQKSKEHQEAAEHSFNNSATEPLQQQPAQQPAQQPRQAWLQQQPTQLAQQPPRQVLVNGDTSEGTFELTGHANDADYEALCGKVDELKDKKKYMDQLLSYYTLLRQTNSSAEQVIHQPQGAPAPPQIFNEQGSDPNTFYQQAKYVEPQRTASPAAQKASSPAQRPVSNLAQHVVPQHRASPTQNSGHQPQASDRLTQADRNERPVSAKHVSRYALDQANELEAVREESRRLRAQQQQQQQQQKQQQQQQQQRHTLEHQRQTVEQPQEGPEEMKKLQDIKAMRSQLSAIQSEMAGIQFNDDDSASNVGSKLKGLEITRNRVKELRDRLMAFEEAPAQLIAPQPEATGDDQMHMLAAAREKLEYLHSLSNKVKQARAGNNGIPEELLKEISILVPDEEVEEEEEEDKEEKFTSLLRKKQELETVQNELKQLRDQQELLQTMDQSGEEARVVIADEDREQLWDTLREKQCAQLDRLKKGDKYEAESCDGYTTRATWGGSSIRSVDTGDAPEEGDDVEGGKYDKTQDEDELEEDLVEEDTEAQLVYELETNYWVEHCRDLSKQLAERTTTIHSLLAERKDKKSVSSKDLQRQLEELHIENEHLHSELNEVYGSESYQGPNAPPHAPPQNPDVSNLGKIGDSIYNTDQYFDRPCDIIPIQDGDESLYSTGSTSRHRAPLPFPAYAAPYPGYYYPPPPHYPHYPPYAPHYPPYPPQQHSYQQYYDPYNPAHTPQYDPAQYQNMQYGQPPPPRGVSSLYNESSLYSEDISRLYDDPNSPYVTRRGGEESLNNTLDKDGLAIDARDQKRSDRNVSFSHQVTTAGDTISTQFPTPRRHQAAQKLAEQGTSVNPQNLSKSSVQNLIKTECEDTQSISSTISSYVNEKREKEKSAFDTLQNTVYSEVASLISANEARPHYLIELVKELGGLKNDYLRQRHLYMLRDLIANYIPSDSGDKQIPPSTFTRHNRRWPRDNWQLSMSEATPSNNSVASENDLSQDFELVKGSNVSVQDADYDYLESVENASSVSTNSHPFASGATELLELTGRVESLNTVYDQAKTQLNSLGATAINLSRDLSDVRQREEMERRLEEMVQNVIAKYGMKKSESSSAADNTSESSGAVSPFDILEQEVKRVMLQVIPLLRDNFASPLTEDLISQIKEIVIHSAGNVFDSDQISENFGSNLSTALAKYSSESVEQCAHDIIVDLSEVLFQDVHTVHIIVDEEISDVGMDEDSDDDMGPTPTPQDLRSRFLASTCGYEESDDPELEFDERRGGEVECAVSHVTEDQDDEDELKIVDEDELHPRFSETGELFSDEGMSSRDEGMSDIVELPPTSDSDDEVPTKEVTLADLPTKLTMTSYRDAVLSGTENSQHSEHSDHAAVLEVLDDTQLVGDGDSIREPPIAGDK